MTWGEQNTQKEAFQQMDFSVDREVNFFDTAEFTPYLLKRKPIPKQKL
jgi:aryl-alcohol dehydrogenase-like predicted oxidoreductase